MNGAVTSLMWPTRNAMCSGHVVPKRYMYLFHDLEDRTTKGFRVFFLIRDLEVPFGEVIGASGLGEGGAI
ncbi:TATA binding protein-associated factor-like protein [Corchorus olitorius]|uniref:TATA binding protein-associated factor-like protein n=1 Tax=Corchorus olitorius TaxID=93759 RepID=A0A1R3KIC4_9ROSI|nr:TATA binding protein-associated factor-like protein [Corchorus olitorius]